MEPRSGIVAFAAAVVLTILATDAFDPQLIWAEPKTKSRGSAARSPATS
ncbi:MAG: paraquat-inducible protein A [Opitutaceae bacterium]